MEPMVLLQTKSRTYSRTREVNWVGRGWKPRPSTVRYRLRETVRTPRDVRTAWTCSASWISLREVVRAAQRDAPQRGDLVLPAVGQPGGGDDEPVARPPPIRVAGDAERRRPRRRRRGELQPRRLRLAVERDRGPRPREQHLRVQRIPESDRAVAAEPGRQGRESDWESTIRGGPPAASAAASAAGRCSVRGHKGIKAGPLEIPAALRDPAGRRGGVLTRIRARPPQHAPGQAGAAPGRVRGLTRDPYVREVADIHHPRGVVLVGGLPRE
eukprot:gene78-biopygen431